MIFAGIDVNIITHEKALSAGVEALGLWVWGMCYSQIHETDGRLPRVAVMSAFGEQKRVLRRLVVRLVSSGLWVEPRCGRCRVCIASESGSGRVQVAFDSRPSQVQVASESGSSEVCDESECGSFFVIRNYDKKNQSSEEIRAKKQASADRVRRWRERRNAVGNALPERVRTDPQTPSENTNTTRKQKEGESAPPSAVTSAVTEDPPISIPLEAPVSEKQPPAWWDDACSTVEFQTGAKINRGAAWLRYYGHRETAGKRIAKPDAVYWLTTVDAREAAKDRDDRRRADARYSRFAPRGGPPEPAAPPTEAEARANAERLAERIAARKAREAKGAA